MVPSLLGRVPHKALKLTRLPNRPVVGVVVLYSTSKTGQVERGYRRVRAPVNTSRGNVPYVILAQNI
jgi:hypothetical protein